MSSKTIPQNILISILVIFLSGCASIVSKSKYPLSINSNPTGAKIVVTNKYGLEIYTGKTPALVLLNAGDGFFTKATYFVSLGKDGYDTKTFPIEFKLDGWYIGNILFGTLGLVGVLVIDPVTGAMWKPKSQFIHETLQKTYSDINSPGLKIFDYNYLPDNWKTNLSKIN